MATPISVNSVANELSNYPNFYRLIRGLSDSPTPPLNVLLGFARAAGNELANFPVTRQFFYTLLTGGPVEPGNALAVIAELQGTFPTLAAQISRTF
jgi:hypothetical protein